MGFLKAIFVIAITMALSIAVITMNGGIRQLEQVKPSQDQHESSSIHDSQNKIALPSKRLSRFLAEYSPPQDKNPRAADHCKWDNDVCSLAGGYENNVYHKNTTKCCNNKCMDLGYDDKNCGACKNKCKFTHTCCRGECVDLDLDKRHCGACNHRCEKGQFCVYGLCDYA